MNNNDLILNIKDVLNKVHNREYKNKTDWTSVFKTSLKELGEKYKYNVYPNDKDGEWLVDLCWSSDGKDWEKDFKGLKLACEIEWSRDINEIIYDFQKLTVIDADIRLFIFQFNSIKEYNKVLDAIETASKYTIEKKYSYLIAGSGNKNSEVEMRFKAIDY